MIRTLDGGPHFSTRFHCRDWSTCHPFNQIQFDWDGCVCCVCCERRPTSARRLLHTVNNHFSENWMTQQLWRRHITAKIDHERMPPPPPPPPMLMLNDDEAAGIGTNSNCSCRGSNKIKLHYMSRVSNDVLCAQVHIKQQIKNETQMQMCRTAVCVCVWCVYCICNFADAHHCRHSTFRADFRLENLIRNEICLKKQIACLCCVLCCAVFAKATTQLTDGQLALFAQMKCSRYLIRLRAVPLAAPLFS